MQLITRFFTLLALAFPWSLFAASGPATLITGIGLFDAGHSNQGMLMLEYRFSHPDNHLHKVLGINLTTDESFLGYFGLGYEIGITENYRLTPMFSAGYYSKGNGQDLGSLIQFRPSMEIARLYSNQIKLGFQYAFLSNFGLSHTNPGAHSINLFVGLPLSLIL